MKVHELKSFPEFFKEIVARRKTSDFRKEDRDFMAGDLVLLREWEPEQQTDKETKVAAHYTGKLAILKINHVLFDKPAIGLPAGYCVLSIQCLWFGAA